MKYQIRWWATKKEVNTTIRGYDQVKIDVGGETEVNDHEAAMDSVNTTLVLLNDYDYIELKLLRLGEESE